jgi:hypothetical protein
VTLRAAPAMGPSKQRRAIRFRRGRRRGQDMAGMELGMARILCSPRP